MPPVIALAACYTDVAAQDEAGSFAAGLAQAGAAAVIGTQTSVTDRYATKLFARVYAELASSRRADVIRAVAEARWKVQQELARSQQPIEVLLATLDEWSVVTVLAGQPSVTPVDAAVTTPIPPQTSVEVGGLLARPLGQFVGRRTEQRTLPAVLREEAVAGLVLHGIGGVGKTTLAAEVLRRTGERDPGWRIVTCTGELSVDGIFAAVAARIRPELLRRQIFDGPMAVAIKIIERLDVPWQDRFTLLRDDVLTQIPVLLVLDNFEDSLTRGEGTSWTVSDPFVADLLTDWAARPARSRMVITARYRFTLPGGSHDRLRWHHVAPLSRAETRKLTWTLPSLDRYATDPHSSELVWRTLGGHPRTLEYLDALLNNGRGCFDDITGRLTTAVERRLSADETATWLAQERTLDAALAETVTLAADDVLLTEHLGYLSAMPGALRLLAGISVYRRPVDYNGLLFQVGTVDETAEFLPDLSGIGKRIEELLIGAGLTIDDIGRALNDDGALSARDRDSLLQLLSRYRAEPNPPRRPPANLESLLAALVHASLVHIDAHGEVVMHSWTATELHRRSQAAGETDLLHSAHRDGATYWRWRARVWPQTSAEKIEDWIEARYHLLAADDTESAGTVTEHVCASLHQQGAWDREVSLIHDTLKHLPAGSPRRPAWYQQLGIIAHDRGDYAEAERRYRQALTINEALGDRQGIANIYGAS